MYLFKIYTLKSNIIYSWRIIKFYFVTEYLNIEEIGLIILLAIILLFVILFIILVIIKCRQRKRSRDFLSS